MINYEKISSELVKGLPERTKDVIERRFGLKKGPIFDFSGSPKIKRESLESIGKDYRITRERVRQIENDGMKTIKNKIGNYKQVFQSFEEKIENFGGFKKEDAFLSALGEGNNLNHIFFLLNIEDSFFRFSENQDFHSFWTRDIDNFNYAKEMVGSFRDVLNREKRPIALQECEQLISLATDQKVASSLEISKHIHQSRDGLFGLKSWPEVNPKGIKDKAYLVLKKEGSPLHFTSVAKLIDESALPQTVHNELIKDKRFILIGRGIYALEEWGYKTGEVKDVVLEILNKSKKPLSKEEIIERVMKQRMVKRNTVLQNLSNKKLFARNSDGKFIAA